MHLELLGQVATSGVLELRGRIELVPVLAAGAAGADQTAAALAAAAAVGQAARAELQQAGCRAEVVPGEGCWILCLGPAAIAAGGWAATGIPAAGTSAAAPLTPALEAGTDLSVGLRTWGPLRLYDVRLSVRPGAQFLAGLRESLRAAAGAGSGAAAPPPGSLTASLILDLPGVPVSHNAEARAGRSLYWELDLSSGTALEARATSLLVELLPVAGIACLLALAVWAAVLGGDAARRGRRARHGSGREGRGTDGGA